jgi:hypothetical protein
MAQTNRKPASPLPTVAAPAPAPVLAAVPAAAAPVLPPATYAGLPFASLTKSQQAFATAKVTPTLPAKLAQVAFTLGPVQYRVRSGNNAAWWAQCMAAMQGGPATAAAMVAMGACPKFVGYAVARKWLAAQKA